MRVSQPYANAFALVGVSMCMRLRVRACFVLYCIVLYCIVFSTNPVGPGVFLLVWHPHGSWYFGAFLCVDTCSYLSETYASENPNLGLLAHNLHTICKQHAYCSSTIQTKSTFAQGGSLVYTNLHKGSPNTKDFRIATRFMPL